MRRFHMLLVIMGILALGGVVSYFVFDFLRVAGSEPSVSHIGRFATNTEFSASDTAVVFPVPLSRARNGLLFIDRVTGKKSIIGDDKESYLTASLSESGKILIVKRQADLSYLLDCEIKSWRCNALLKTENLISSVVRARNGAIFFSASPPVMIQGRKRFGDFDIFVLEVGSSPKQLTKVGLYVLDAISDVGGRLYFTAAGSAEPDILLHRFPAAGLSSSQIYALDYDLASYEVKLPERKLKALFQVAGGVSTHSTVSADGSRVAFLFGGGYKYDVAIATAAGELLKIISPTEGSFSRPAITSNEVLVNELAYKQYTVLAIDRTTYQWKFLFDVLFDEVDKLDRIMLNIVAQ